MINCHIHGIGASSIVDSPGLVMPSIVIYTKRFCPYCHAAKALLARKKLDFIEIDIDGDDQAQSKMAEKAAGRWTVPQIFVGTTHIGGCDDLYALDQNGGLDRLLTSV
jgi:glutaredoxin 3